MDLRTIIAKTLGPVIFLEEEIPGVFYASVHNIRTGLLQEYYIADTYTDSISDNAKNYGKPLPHHPELIAILNGVKGGGDLVIRYEIKRYKISHNNPVSDDDGLYETAMFGMLDYPDYFGAYPAPIDTPEGKIVRYRQLHAGVFDLTAENGKQLLSIAEPVWSTELSDSVLSLGVYMNGYLFFSSDKQGPVLVELNLSDYSIEL